MDLESDFDVFSVLLDHHFTTLFTTCDPLRYPVLFNRIKPGETPLKWFQDWDNLQNHLLSNSFAKHKNSIHLISYLLINSSLRLPVSVQLTRIPENLTGKSRYMMQVVRRHSHKSAENTAHEHELIHLRTIFNSRLEGTFTTDCKGTITLFNKAAENITGYKISEVIGQPCWEIMKTSICHKGCYHHATRGASLKKFQGETQNIHIEKKDHSKIPIRVNTAPLYSADGQINGLVCSFLDISETHNLRKHLQNVFTPMNLIGQSPQIAKVMQLIQQVGPTDSKVMITGESGTGKELVARSIHLYSEHHNGPFIALNCAALVETLLESELFGHEKGAFTGAINNKPGLLEKAKGGTLFLDEIGDISLSAQVKLLRVLESKTFQRVGGTQSIPLEARLITATNKELEVEIAKENFRSDFYYRINVINIKLAPLRDRPEDIELLTYNFLRHNPIAVSRGIHTVTDEARRILLNYPWPGNIRELENVLEYASVMSPNSNISPESMPERMLSHSMKLPNTKNRLEELEREFIHSALRKNNGNRKKTSEALNMNPSTLWRKMKKYELA